MSNIQNARISSAFLGIEGRGFFTIWIHLDGGGWGQGYGGYALDNPPVEPMGERTCRTGYPGECIRRLLDTFKVESWDELVGTPLRVRREGGNIQAIGHFMEPRWFSFQELGKEFFDAQ